MRRPVAALSLPPPSPFLACQVKQGDVERLNRTQELSRSKDVSAKTFAIVSEMHSTSGWALQSGSSSSPAQPAKARSGALLGAAQAEEEVEELLAGVTEASPSGRGGGNQASEPARPCHAFPAWSRGGSKCRNLQKLQEAVWEPGSGARPPVRDGAERKGAAGKVLPRAEGPDRCRQACFLRRRTPSPPPYGRVSDWRSRSSPA